jgi:YD repeat-containing protein
MSLDIEALFAVPSVGSFELSKFANKIVFSSNKSGQWQLYHGELLDSSLQSNQLTYDPESKLGAKFFPDGNSLIYAKDYQGDENFDIFHIDIKNPKPRNLTPETDFSILPDISISQDGRRLAFVSNKSGEFATYVMKIEDGSMERISHHKFSDGQALFSPVDSHLVFVSNVAGQDNAMFLSSPDGEILRLDDPKTHEIIDASEPEWSPDGKKIAFVSSSKGSYDIGLWNITSNELEWLTNSEHEYYDPKFSRNGKKLIYSVNMEGDIKFILHDLELGVSNILDFKHGVVGSPNFTEDDRAIVFLFTGSKNPPDLWKYDFESQKFTQLTNSLPPNIDTSNFVDGKQVYYKCKKDGLDIPALLFIPKKTSGKPKAIIDIHGGPTGQELNTWDPIRQVMSLNGFVILSPNYRGSTGYGKKFREANRFVMGDLDLADCASGWDYLVEEGIADGKRIAVMGGSFGGYLTMCALTKYPDRWICGSALVPFLNWFTEIKNEREDLRHWDYENMGDPEKDKLRLREASPIFFIDKIRSPVQLTAGAHDPRCPLEESMQAKDELQKLGKEVDFKFYEDEGHGFRKMQNRIDAYKRAVTFLLKHFSD